MSKIDDGGSVHPMLLHSFERGGTIDHEYLCGKSLRDDFAGIAMLAELQSAGSFKGPADALRQAAARAGRTIEQQVAWNSYQMADAMLAERAKVRP